MFSESESASESDVLENWVGNQKFISQISF